MSDWAAVPLESVLDQSGVSYGIVQPGHADPNGVPIVRVGDLLGDRISQTDPLRVTQGVEAAYARTRLRGGEVLLSIVGTVGRVAVVPQTMAAWNVARAIAVLRPSDPKDAGWIRYSLLSPDVQSQMHMRKTDTVQATLNLRDVKKLMIPWPSEPERWRIAAVLGALDDLIDAEESTASLADALWRAVVASELGHPDTLPLASLASFVNGKNFTKGGGKLGLPVIRTPEVRGGPTSSTVRNDVPAAEGNIAQAGDILFVWSGSLLVSRWQWQPGLVNQHIFKVLPAAGVPDWLVLWAIEESMEDFLGVAADKATTMGHVRRGDLERPVAVPARSRWDALDAKLRPFWDEAHAARIHASELARARDVLLPLLMSGKVRVSEDLAVA